MRVYRIALPLTLILLPVDYAAAQPDDNAVCNQLVRLGRPGLFIVSDGRIARVQSGAVGYDPGARLYYQPGAGGRIAGEGVWHVRTQTRARATPDADAAIVYRPPVTTQCSNGRPLFAFDADQRFVSLRRYIDHHAAVDWRTDAGLRDYFHFAIRDPGSNRCIRTDDRSVYGNLETIYGFTGIQRSQPTVASALTFSRSAHAQVASGFSSLSSEFAYRSQGESDCFGFSVPLPTYPISGGWFSSRYKLAFRAAQQWHPLETSIVIKQFNGRKVVQVTDATVVWGQR